MFSMRSSSIRPPLLALVFAPVLLLAHPALAGPASDDGIEWVHSDLEAALTQARGGGKGVAIYFWMEGSAFCSRMYGETLTDPRAATALEGWTCVSADVGSEGAPLFARYSVTTLPAVLFLTREGIADDAILGFIPIASFESEVARIEGGEGTVRALEAAVAAAPDDLALRLQLAVKLGDVGRADDGKAMIESIKRDDPDGETVVGARILLSEARDAVRDAAADPADPNTWDLEPLIRRVERTRPPEVRFEGWDLVARTRLTRGERSEAFDAWREAHRVVPDERLVELAFQVGDAAWSARDDLRNRDEKLFLDLAEALVEELEAESEAAEAAAAAEGEGDAGSDAPPPPVEEEEPGATLADGLELLARAWAVNGKRRQALQAIERALELEPTSARLQDTKAELEKR